jgi:pyridoxamine 5'-phosphate oxidase-like protein
MYREDVIAVLNKPLALELMHSIVPARIAYNGPDGYPRVVPVGFLWNGEEIVFCSPVNAAKVKSLQANPRVAITIDTEGMPPLVLFIRGDAAVAIVDGIPEEFLEASRRRMPEEAFVHWEEDIRALYDRMAVITITPNWAKLIDFETTLPSAIAELIEAKGAGAQP